MVAAVIDLLGGFRVTVDGRPISNDAWRSRRAADLVKTLALARRHRLHRDSLMDMLWADLSPEAAAANLRKAVHYARRAADSDEFIGSSGGMLELCPGADVVTDVERFEDAYRRALQANELESATAAADLYPGDLLPDNPADPWTEPNRSQLRGHHLQMLRAAGRWATVAELDPWDETAHRALMRDALAAGNRAEALRIFEALRARLADDLSIEPSAATLRLCGAIRGVARPEGDSPAAEVRSLIARGLLNYWGRVGLDEAEQVALRARTVALQAGLGAELGEASTLLSIVGMYQGTWWDRFRADFALAVTQPRQAAVTIFDALLCFTEFYLDAPQGADHSAAAAEETLLLARSKASTEGQALARLMSGEVHLVSGRLDEARKDLSVALRDAEASGWAGGQSIALQRSSEASYEAGDRDRARDLARRGVAFAKESGIPSHLLVRALSAQVRAAPEPGRALIDAEAILNRTPTCEPCAMSYLFVAIDASVDAGQVADARVFLEDAERIGGLWGSGPWHATIWFARGRIREAEGEIGIANAFYLEAARGYAAASRPLDEARCRTAASH